MPRRPKIVTLLPSATEHVAALGYADAIVGRSHECDFPEGIEEATPLTVPRIDSSLPSGEIDRSVREALRDVLTVYELDVEALEALEPDIIVTQDLCDVCAVDFDDVSKAVEELGLDTEIVRLHPTKLDDIRRDLLSVAAVIGDIEAGEKAVAEMEDRYRAIRASVAPRESTPRTLTIEWIDPVMIGGTWMPEMIEMCGGQCLVTKPGDHAPTLETEALKALDPEVVLIKPCGFDLERTREEKATLKALLDAMPWTAVETGRVYVADGNAYFNRSGPRIVDSAEILAACIHPELCGDYAARHAGSFERIDEFLGESD
jgi:iron complex transport system substrate-binding protein